MPGTLCLLAQAKRAEAALSDKIQDSKQWQQMKKLMQQKSQEVAALRKRLGKYEPQEIPAADTIGTKVADDEF